MESAIVMFKFGAKKLPVRGFKCPRCDEAAALGDEIAAARAYAEHVGLVPPRRSAQA